MVNPHLRICTPNLEDAMRKGDKEREHPYAQEEVRNGWYKIIDDRLEIDCRMTNLRYGRRGLEIRVVTNTWKGTLEDEEDLPSNWPEVSGVLVGRSKPPQQGVG